MSLSTTQKNSILPCRTPDLCLRMYENNAAGSQQEKYDELKEKAPPEDIQADAFLDEFATLPEMGKTVHYKCPAQADVN